MKFKKWVKGHKELVTLVMLPLIMTALVGLFYILPTAFKTPGYDFVYAKCSDYCYSTNFNVIDGKITETDRYSSSSYGSSYRTQNQNTFYLYDMETGNSELLDEFDRGELEVDDSSEAPDGFKIERGSYSGGGIFFGGYSSDDYNKFFAVNGAAKKELNLESTNYSDIEIIGWVVVDAR